MKTQNKNIRKNFGSSNFTRPIDGDGDLLSLSRPIDGDCDL